MEKQIFANIGRNPHVLTETFRLVSAKVDQYFGVVAHELEKLRI